MTVPSVFTTFVPALDCEVNVHDQYSTLLDVLSPLGNGAYREVFELNDDYVLKIPHRNGWRSRGICTAVNASEVERWESFVGTDREAYFVPVIAADPTGHWTVFPKCEMKWYYSNKAYKDPYNARQASADCGVGDLHEENFGIYNGVLVCTDYADNSVVHGAEAACDCEACGNGDSDSDEQCDCSICRSPRYREDVEIEDAEIESTPKPNPKVFFLAECSCEDCARGRERYEEAMRLWEERNA